MADNVELNAGTGGAIAATDDCGAAGHTQIIKLAIATDGSATLIPATAAAGLLVNPSDSATRDNGIIDIGAALPAGDNNIGNVDVLSSALPTGASTLAEQQSQTTHLATIAGDTTDIEAAVELIDDTVATLGTTTYTEATTKGLIIGAVRRDADTTLVDTTNEITPLQVDANGRLKVEAFSGETLPVSLSGVSTLAEQQSQTTHLATIAGDTTAIETAVQIMDDWDNAASDGASVSGDVAHDTADAGEPVKLGAKAETAPSAVTAVADGDRTNLYAGADGILYVRPYCALEDIVSGVDTDTDGSSTSVISAPGAGIRLYITSVIVKNTHASTDAYVDIRDGTAGSVLASIPAPAAGGAVVSFPVPLRLTANTACGVDPSAAVTTIITTVVGFKAAV